MYKQIKFCLKIVKLIQKLIKIKFFELFVMKCNNNYETLFTLIIKVLVRKREWIK